ncbi:hypothetical protein DENIS_2128 [Desulfonema ishimotonii]|uniref:Fibronectin type-III domain-containing protein n=1 Tax=Desulfonema ishimotonii TaxID=45657 RepID=A0A401FW27_9BACT|nr:hypothetical protein [Desulfonema ishimotonii]GBC61168.1 hypothetical protein DENIS_2128 [Desulfonema ishimotonii]
MRRGIIVFLLSGLFICLTGPGHAWTPVPVADDPLVRMPGTQPGQTALEAPGRCLNCHAGYNTAVEPGYNWTGSMMAQASRDFLYWSCLTVAAQDSVWAIGTPNAADICERCHFPKGWLEGRSDPPNASAMTGADFDGVQCDFCHSMYDPFFETTYAGTREGSDWLNYWDETNASSTPSQTAADATYTEDMALAETISLFNGIAFFVNSLPPANYTENGSGQYFASPNGQKRASFADANARHRIFYSRYHKSRFFCATCHDVSNPVLANLGQDGTQPLTTETNSAYSYFHVERTFSEFMLSAYGQQGGAATNPEFQNQGAPDITHAAKCQDCHMRDMTGQAARMRIAVVRPGQSVEHPDSGQPLHDLTGGNAWVSWVLASTIPGSPNYDPFNEAELNKGPEILTLDLTQGEGIDPAALLAGVDRARQQLLLAATIKNLTYHPGTGNVSFQVQNNSAHKLISGFPEGRRMFVNIRAYAGDILIYEVNPYDTSAQTLKGLGYSYESGGLLNDNPVITDPETELYADELVYEMKPGSNLTGEAKSFHFALADGRYKDNRIPPKGFDISNAAARLASPVLKGVEENSYFSADEYLYGCDEVSMDIAPAADYVEVSLFYQITSREYIEFLRDEINGTGTTLFSPTLSGEPEAYIIQTDPFFSRLRAWGDTIWNLWTHNIDADCASPFLMARATYGSAPTGCTAPVPTLLSATPDNTGVVLNWSDESADQMAAGYRIYYDQAGKSQWVADLPDPTVTTYIDTGLTNGLEYCYKVTSYYDATCESAFSNILCAIPAAPGQTTDPASVTSMETGIYIGRGRARTYTPQTTFNAGNSVVIRATVIDSITGLPIAGATVDLLITGPETLTLVTGLSDASGMAEAIWQTRTQLTAPGEYTVQPTNVTIAGYHWDGVQTSAVFTIE